MKKNYTLLLILLIPASIMLFFAGTLFHSGSPGGKTGSPGDNGVTCTQCHNGTAESMDGMISTNIPSLGYVVGDTYELTLTAEHESAARYGFELTAEDEAGNKVGQFIISGDGETQLANSNNAITHTSSGITPDGNMKTWMFEWTAPSSDVGLVTFYTAVNAANNNGGTGGDVIYTSTLSVDESSVGIAHNIEEAFFTISPNPSQGAIQISHEYQMAQIRIISLDGKISWHTHAYLSGQTIDLSQLNNGIYMVQLQNGNNIKTQKLVLN